MANSRDGEVPSGSVLGLYSRPVVGDRIGGHLRLQGEDHLDLGKREPELASRCCKGGQAR